MTDENVKIKVEVNPGGGGNDPKKELNSILEAVKGLVEGLKHLHETSEIGEAGASGLGGALSALGAVVGATTIVVTGIVVAFGAFIAVMEKTVEAAQEVFRQIRELQATSGLTAHAADVLTKSYELAGIESGKLSLFLFRLSAQMESGGKVLEQYGISVRDMTGALKEPGQVFEEVMAKARGMSDVQERLNLLHAIGGRQARAFATAVGLSSEKWDEYVKAAEHASVVDKNFMEQNREFAKSAAELSHEWEKVKLQIATTIGLPVMKFFTDFTKTLLEHKNVLKEVALSIADMMTPFGGLYRLITGKSIYQKALGGGGGKSEHGGAEGGEEQTKGTTRLTEMEAKRLEQEVKMEDEQKRRRLQSDAAFFAEREKLMTGSDTKGVESRISANEELIRLATEQYSKLMEIERRAHPEVDKETELKFRKERDDAILKAEEEIRKLTLEIGKARAADAKRVLDDEVRDLKANTDERLAILKERETGQLAINKLMVQSKVASALEENSITEKFAKERLDARATELNREQSLLKDYARQFPDNYAVQHEVQQKLVELEKQRVSAEMEANGQIINSRTAMVQKLKQLADEEAGIGDSITNKAIDNLRKRGKTRISQSDVDWEAQDIQRKGASTAGTFATGGRVKINDLQDAMSNKSMFRNLNQIGSSIGGAVNTAAQSTAASFTGQEGPSMPSNVMMGFGGKPIEVDQMLGTDKIAMAYQKSFAAAATAADKAISEISAKIDAGNSVIADKLFERFMDQMIRKLEFEASRT